MTTSEARNLVTRYEERYGKLAFGTCTLLIVWFAMIQPMQAETSRTAANFANATANLAATAQSLERMQLSSRGTR